MKSVILKTKPNSSFHFGRYAPDSDTGLSDTDSIFHSDSLFSALVVNYNAMFEDTDDFVHQFKNEYIKISSLNYYIEQNGTKIWFLPKPISFNTIETQNHKSFKKIAYLSKTLYESIQNPEDLLGEDIVIVQERFALKKDELQINKDLLSHFKLYNNTIHQKVYVSKENQGDDLYQLNVIEIADNTAIANTISVGFYFLLETTSAFNTNFGNKFNAVLEVLKTAGIGAERSTIGQLSDIVIEDWNLRIDNPHPTYALALSMIHPKDETQKIVYAQTELRGGRTLSMIDNYKKGRQQLKVIRLLNEGAIVNQDMKGHIENIAPNDWQGIPFLRHGKALTINVNKNWFKDDAE